MKTLTLDERIERLTELKRQRQEIDREIMEIFATAPVRSEPTRRGRPRKDGGPGGPPEENGTAPAPAESEEGAPEGRPFRAVQ